MRGLFRSVIVALLAAAAVVACVYVGWGGDALVPDEIATAETRERLRLVFAGFGALTAPLALWVALTAYRLNSQLARMNLDARFDVVPDTKEHRGEKERVRFEDGVRTDMEQSLIIFTDNPAGTGSSGTWYFAIPLINHGAGTADIQSATAEIGGQAFAPGRPSRRIVRQKEVVFLLFAPPDGKDANRQIAGARATGQGPSVHVTYRNLSGDQEAAVKATVRGDVNKDDWYVDTLVEGD
jgi:hypothetical protein